MGQNLGFKNRQPSSLLDKDGSYLEDLWLSDDELLNMNLKMISSLISNQVWRWWRRRWWFRYWKEQMISKKIIWKSWRRGDEEVDVDVDLLDDRFRCGRSEEINNL